MLFGLISFSGAIAYALRFLNIANVALTLSLCILMLFSSDASSTHVFSGFWNYISCIDVAAFGVYHCYCSCVVCICDGYQLRGVSLSLFHGDFECWRVARIHFFDVLQLRVA